MGGGVGGGRLEQRCGQRGSLQAQATGWPPFTAGLRRGTPSGGMKRTHHSSLLTESKSKESSAWTPPHTHTHLPHLHPTHPPTHPPTQTHMHPPTHPPTQTHTPQAWTSAAWRPGATPAFSAWGWPLGRRPTSLTPRQARGGKGAGVPGGGPCPAPPSCTPARLSLLLVPPPPTHTHPTHTHTHTAAAAAAISLAGPSPPPRPQGQNWGFPSYDWEAMARDGYAWWRRRLTHMAQCVSAGGGVQGGLGLGQDKFIRRLPPPPTPPALPASPRAEHPSPPAQSNSHTCHPPPITTDAGTSRRCGWTTSWDSSESGMFFGGG